MTNTNIQDLIDRGALFVVNHSGGKDSQAMYIKLAALVPHDQLLVVHATLGDIEWQGVQEHIKATINHDLVTCCNPNKTNSKAGREWYDWLPIADLTEAEVFQTIADAGQEPHWAYAAGMSRLSCAFCIMASQGDLETAARLRPELLGRIVEIETRIGHTFRMPRKGQPAVTLDKVVGSKETNNDKPTT